MDWKQFASLNVCDRVDSCRSFKFMILDNLNRLEWNVLLFEKRLK